MENEAYAIAKRMLSDNKHSFLEWIGQKRGQHWFIGAHTYCSTHFSVGTKRHVNGVIYFLCLIMFRFIRVALLCAKSVIPLFCVSLAKSEALIRSACALFVSLIYRCLFLSRCLHLSLSLSPFLCHSSLCYLCVHFQLCIAVSGHVHRRPLNALNASTCKMWALQKAKMPQLIQNNCIKVGR